MSAMPIHAQAVPQSETPPAQALTGVSRRVFLSAGGALALGVVF